MTSNLKSQFEKKIADQTRDPSVEVIEKTTWRPSGNSGGGHTGHDGKYKGEKKGEIRKKPPPPKKSLSDLP